MGLEDFDFPILAISKGSVLTLDSPSEASVGTPKAIASGYFDELLLVDSSGRAASVTAYESSKVSLLSRLMNKSQSISLTLRRERDMSLQDVRAVIEEHVEMYPELYSTDNGGLKRRLVDATEIAQLVDAFR
ncbi:MAG: hypothetical protein AAFU77_16045 [Myxococcota bacterium]